MSKLKKPSVRCRSVGRFFFALTVSALILHACTPPPQLQKINGEAQGSFYTVQYYDPLQRNLRASIDTFLAGFDQEASLWEDSSLLRRLNCNQTDSLSPLLADMLEKSLYIHDYTDGAFDCRIGRIVQAWGFSFKQRQTLDSTTLDSLLRFAHGHIAASCGRLIKQYPQTELDFNAIAQGYATDLLAAKLDSLGIENYLINIGGEMIVRGQKPNGKPWHIGVERPAADSLSMPEVQTSIALRDAALVTSGNYRKYYEKDGQRYSHTIDPATGRPVQHSLLSATVVEKDCWLADAMATAYMVMGLDRARAFIASHPNGPGTSAVMLIYYEDGQMQTYTTQAFESLVIHKAK